MASVFVSYARHDRDRVRWVVENLKSARHDVFWDENMHVSELWQQHLLLQLQTCECLLVVWSSTSVASDWVQREFREARDNGKEIVPVRIDKIKPPPWGAEFNYADLTEWRGNRSHHEWSRVCAVLSAPKGKRRLQSLANSARAVLRDAAAPSANQILSSDPQSDVTTTIRVHSKKDFQAEIRRLQGSGFELVRLEDDLAILRKTTKPNRLVRSLASISPLAKKLADASPATEEVTIVIVGSPRELD